MARRPLRAAACLGAIAGMVALFAAPGVGGTRQADDCGDLGTAADFNAFVRGNYTAENLQIQGRVAAGGDVSLRSFNLGTALTANRDRIDLIAGGDLTASNGQVSSGSVTYGGALTGSIGAPNGTITRAPPPFDFPDEFTELTERATALAALTPNGSIVGPTFGALDLTGSDPGRNVFSVEASRLQTAQQIRIRVPFGSTTIVTVTGASYTTTVYPTSSIAFWDGDSYEQFSDTAPTPELEALRRALLWNFPDATTVQIGPNLAWHGTVLAPRAAVTFPGSTQLNGQMIAGSLEGNGTLNHRPFAGCLPSPEPPPVDPDLTLEAGCLDTVTDRHAMRLRNAGRTDRPVTWSDRLSAQGGTFTAPARTDTYFDVEDGAAPHLIEVRGGTSRPIVAATTGNPCQGTLVLRKVVTGPGTAPPGAWTIRVRGTSGLTRTVELEGGEQARLTVPSHLAAGSVPIGVLPAGYLYAVREPDPRGAVATVDKVPVSIQVGDVQTVTVGNDYPDAPVPPDPPDPPVPPIPPQPPAPVARPSRRPQT